MTHSQICALEWAVDQLTGSDTPEMLTLCELAIQAKHQYTQFGYYEPNLLNFMARWGIGIPLKEFDSWRMLPIDDQRLGEIVGLPESRGTIRCTNGIMCYIERVGKFPYLGHIQHFVNDRREPQADPYKVPKAKRKSKSAVEKMLEEITEFEA